MSANQLGRFMKQRRAELGITQAQLAARLGVAQGYVSMIERGKKAWPESYVDAIARELQVLPSDLAEAAGRAKDWEEIKIALDRGYEIGGRIRARSPELQQVIDEFATKSDEEQRNLLTELMDSWLGMTQMYLGAQSTTKHILERLEEMVGQDSTRSAE